MRRLLAVAAAALLLAGCTPSAPTSERPDPVPIVESYLAALASGDSATAHGIDAVAFEDAPFLQGDGTGVLDTGALAAASERIVVDGATLLSADDDSAAVEAAFSLDGVDYTPTLRFRWDDDGGSWVMIDSLANIVVIDTVTAQGVEGPVPYTIAGFSPTGAFDGFDAPATYAYPGVYALSVQIDPALLADPATPIELDLTVPPYYTAPQKGALVAPVEFLLR